MRKFFLTYRIFLISGFIGLNFILIVFLAKALGYFNTGASKIDIFHGDLEINAYYTPNFSFSLNQSEGRPLDPQALESIKNDYLSAWFARNQAFDKFSTENLADFYTEEAAQKIQEHIRENQKKKLRVSYTTLSHHFIPTYYSIDGNIVAFRDQSVSSIQRVYHNGILIQEFEEISDYNGVMVLHNGKWKIRNMHKNASFEKTPASSQSNGTLSNIRGVNYYPMKSPWDTFGEEFNKGVLLADFKEIYSLGFNTIRIFIDYHDFGAANVLDTKVEKLKTLLDAAADSNLQVQITLFDFYSNYAIDDWTQTQAHLITIANEVKIHPALWSWDIKNEPDLDYRNVDSSLVNSWLQTMISSLRSVDPSHPITIGWSNPEVMGTLEESIDFHSFHYYRPLTELPSILRALEKRYKKPIVLQELGLSTYRGLWKPFGASEDDQFEYYKTFLNIQEKSKLNFMIWTLNDFEEVPGKVVGRAPWKKAPQGHFGIKNREGKKKRGYFAFSEN